MEKVHKHKKLIFVFLGGAFLLLLFYFIIPVIFEKTSFVKSDFEKEEIENKEVLPTEEEKIILINPEDSVIVTHIDTPIFGVKGIYMSSWVAATPSFRKKLVDLIDRTEINSVIIDIKDYSGNISFTVSDPYLLEMGSAQKRIPDIKQFIDTLHKKNIYVIGRISSFQDQYMVKKRPDLAVKKLSNKNEVWRDYKGIAWVDTGSHEIWDYLLAVGRESYNVGFDELNFDYIRFPADGNMKDIYFPISDGKIKKEVVRDFFKYLSDNIRGVNNEILPRPKISGDVFGMVMTNNDDLNIGQQLELDAQYFDYLGPMVYPSHFPKGWNNFSSPASKPYEVIKISMQKGVDRMKAMGQDPKKLRPWLQDFNMGATYTADMVRAQIKATYDVGLDSWMLWDPGNTYTESALLKE